ncbi:DKNYY domain-containing protein [uncultured Campylobacter sp.]|uniref:DKNYY domain-containing protein n=1 Tax=uncultured Campylobacter sp. TaxID=218934 RepID=UPI0026371FED|nr:DKNYY domain-containing protein [uncultured Campylobacter sp.]
MKDKKPILLCLFALFAVLFTVFFMVYVASYEEENEFTQIGNSEFYATPQGKIYALVPSGGKFELKGARVDKFKVLATGGYRGRNVGADESAVYCGNLAMTGLDPSRARAIGNGYFTDGEISYFCSDVGERNYELGGFTEMVQTMAYAIFGADKPQSYIYKTERVSSVNLAPILDFGFAAEKAALGNESGKVYFEGKQLEGADARALRYVLDARGRTSNFYATDGRNVYFKSLRLAVKFTPELHEAAYFNGVHYLLEPASSAVYADEYEFAPEFAPYSLPFGVSGAHAYHLLFRGKGGIYFWQRHSGGESGELKRAADDPFAGDISPLEGSVFISGAQTYFVQSREVWHRNKSGRRLGSRHTEVFRLKTNEQWRKIGLVRNGVYGAVYANGYKIYYFDAMGTGQLIDSSIYEIADTDVTEILTRPYDPRGKNPSSEDIRKMIKDGRLVPAQGELVFEAVTSYDGEERYYLWIFLGVAILAAIVGKAYEYKSRAKAVENETATKPRGKVKFRR